MVSRPALHGSRSEGHAPRPSRRLLVSVALVSFSLMAYEIALSRLLSVLLSYHFVFLVLSLALLGLGLGGLLLHLLAQEDEPEEEEPLLLVKLGAGLSAAVPASSLFTVWLAGLEGLGGDVLWYMPPLLVPFALGGAFLAQVYRCLPGSSGITYGADLMGAAAGAPGAILLLQAMGAVGVPLALGVLASSGVIILAMIPGRGGRASSARRYALGCLLICVCLALAHWSRLFTIEISPKVNPGKEIHEALSQFQGRIVESRWSSFGRTDLVAYEGHPHHMDIYLDGTAGSPMYRFRGNLREPEPWLVELQEEFPGFLPLSRLAERERDSALIIGPGGGRDLLLVLMAGVREIEAVEINPDLVEMVRNAAWFNGGIYSGFPGVKVIVEEGRSYLRRQERKYDLIFMSLPVTNTSRSIEGYSLTENYLFTVESMEDYWGHLTDEGRLVVVAHNDAELLRLMVIALRALEKRGLSPPAAMSRIWVVSSGDYLAFVLRKTPFGPADSIWAYTSILERGYRPPESYLPHLTSARGLNPALVALGSGQMGLEELVQKVAQKGYDIRPVSDESPFFYKLEPGIPGSVVGVAGASAGLLLLVGALLLVGRARSQRHPTHEGLGAHGPGPLRAGLLFCTLGVGFISVEICSIQRFSLVLGQPVWTMGMVLFSLLLSGGAGSLLAGRWGSQVLHKRIALSCALVTTGLLAYGASLNPLLHWIGQWPQAARVAAVVLLMAPLGFLMGIPFPLGIRAVGLGLGAKAVPWMWAINGISSVMGSGLSILMALELGFTPALMVASLCYFLAFLAFLKP